MHLRKETSRCHRSDAVIHCLSWMPQRGPSEFESWNSGCLDRGWLAAGNANGVVSVTLTSVEWPPPNGWNCATLSADSCLPSSLQSWCRPLSTYGPSCGLLPGSPSVGFLGANLPPPPRTNFNLRDHKNRVQLVEWNHIHEKLSSCSSAGVIFVWQRNDERWNVELINDRPHQVADFRWSRSGGFVLIAYQDGFVVVGTFSGQRVWSQSLNLNYGGASQAASLTCATWSPLDRSVLLGTSNGYIVCLSEFGDQRTEVLLTREDQSAEVTQLAWNCPRFRNAETSDELSDGCGWILAVALSQGTILLLKDGPEDPEPRRIVTGLIGLKICWNEAGTLLAVAGFIRCANLECSCWLRLYSVDVSDDMTPVACLPVASAGRPVSALCWAHNDSRLFVSAALYLHTFILESGGLTTLRRLAAICVRDRLQFLRRRGANSQQSGLCLEPNMTLSRLPLPPPLQQEVRAAYHHTVQGILPDPERLREFVLLPPSQRLYCTVQRHGDEVQGHYVLYLEFLGGLIPLLLGKRASKLRPEFVIFDPKLRQLDSKEIFLLDREIVSDGTAAAATQKDVAHHEKRLVEGEPDYSSLSSGAEVSEDSAEESQSPYLSRRFASLRKRRQRSNNLYSTYRRRFHADRTLLTDVPNGSSPDELMYNSTLPQVDKLVVVTSNLWGTRFRLVSLAACLPTELVSVQYKSSFLHLQPRQMTVRLTEITRDTPHRRLALPRSLQQDRRQLSTSMMSNSICCEPQFGLVDRMPSLIKCPRSPVDPRRLGCVFNDEDTTSCSLQLSAAFPQQLSSSRKFPVDVSDLRFIDDDSESVLNGVAVVAAATSEAIDMLSFGCRSGGAAMSMSATAAAPQPLVVKRLPSRRQKQLQLQAELEFSRSAPVTPTRQYASTAGGQAAPNSIRCKRSQIDKVSSISHTQSPLLNRFMRSCDLPESEHLQHHKKSAARIGDASCASVVDHQHATLEAVERTFVMHNKQPIWNEQSQVYQLDFGGRVTQESAKNFQMETDGVQVLQFGRLNSSTFSLDFQYPFSPIQAFGVALANLTQRLK